VRTLYLHTVGRRTGKSRRTPLYFVEDGGDFAVITSNAGRDREPAWWLNLQADPDAEIEVGSGRRRVRARKATRARFDRLWPRFVAGLRDYEAYRRKTDRELVIVLLSSVDDRGAPRSVPPPRPASRRAQR
jgi:deazaflavin-dependent oxidoreductase (nitroreductase family)